MAIRYDETLTHRVCSNCVYWGPHCGVVGGIIHAVCIVHNEFRTGGEKCSKWTPKPDQKINGED